jgi:hypothetical protein
MAVVFANRALAPSQAGSRLKEKDGRLKAWESVQQRFNLDPSAPSDQDRTSPFGEKLLCGLYRRYDDIKIISSIVAAASLYPPSSPLLFSGSLYYTIRLYSVVWEDDWYVGRRCGRKAFDTPSQHYFAARTEENDKEPQTFWPRFEPSTFQIQV